MALEQSKEVASEATDKSREVAGAAREQAGAVAQEAAEQAGKVMDEAKTQASRVVDDAKHQLRGQAADQTDKLAESLERLQYRAQALVQGNREEAGPLADYADEAVAKIGEVASKVRSRGFDGMMEDTQRFARRRPGMFLAGAAAVGFLAGRVVRSAKDSQDGQDEVAGPGSWQPGYGYTPPRERPLVAAPATDPEAATTVMAPAGGGFTVEAR